MTWSPPTPHTWSAGDDATSTALQTMTSSINYLISTFPRWGSVAGVTDGNGDLTLTWAAFPTQTESVVVSLGDLLSATEFEVRNSTLTASGVKVRLYNTASGGVITGQLCRVDFAAFGT